VADWGLIAIRFALYADLMLLVGLAAFPIHALRVGERAEGQILSLTKILIFLAIFGVFLSLVGLLALIAAMTGTSIFGIDWETSRSIIFETSIGTAWLVRMVALVTAFLAVVALAETNGRRLIIVAVAGAVALSSLVWTSHAGATEGAVGSMHKASDIAHMLASAIWLGGIAAFVTMLRGPFDRLNGEHLAVAHRALDSFSLTGTICVAVIILTGLINGQILVGFSNIGSLSEGTYGRLFLLKLAFVSLMLVLAAKNRWRLTPDLGLALSDGREAKAVIALRVGLLMEASAAAIVLGLAAWLGTLEPAGNL